MRILRFLKIVKIGLAKDVSSYNQSSLIKQRPELARVVGDDLKRCAAPLCGRGQRGGSPDASRKPPRCWECSGCVEEARSPMISRVPQKAASSFQTAFE